MTIQGITTEEYVQVVESLVNLGDSVNGTRYHKAGPGYTSLMLCFLMHNTVASKSLLRLRDTFSNDWFPVTIGNAIARTMFEININAKYISQFPVDRSRQYIEFEHVLS